MGACASKPYHGKGEPSPGEDAGVQLNVQISRRQMVTPSVDDSKRSTADLISSAFIAQAEPEPTKGITARFAGRRGPEGRRASSQAKHLGIGPAPAAESRAELASGSPATASMTMSKETLSCSASIPVCSTEDSFELSRAETVKRLVIMQKSFKSGGSVPSPAWVFSEAPEPRDDRDASARRVCGSNQGFSSDQPGARLAGRTDSGSGAAEDGSGEPAGTGSEEAGEVMQMDDDLGDGLNSPVSKKAPVAAAGAPAAAAARTGPDAEAEDASAPGGGCEDSRKGEACSTPRRDEDAGAFRTVSISRMQGCAKAAAVDGAAAAANDADAQGAPTATTTDVHSETDELTSLPLPNLICPRAGAGASQAARQQSRAGHRHSASSYLQQAVMEPLVSLSDGVAASRNSDLGYYLEEARFAPAAWSPLRGAQPVRHNLLDSDMVRQRAAQAAKEAEGAARPTPVVLDYVPSTRPQASRGSLLAQPSQKRLLCGGGGNGGGSRISLMGDDDDGDAAAARRLEYVPKKPISRRSSHANLHSGSTLLGAGSTSRPVSPTNSRPSASLPGHQISDCLPISPRTAGADSNERCFHVTRAGTAAAAAAAAAAASSSGSLPSFASGNLLVGATRRRGAVDRRDSASCSQVHFGPTAVLQAPGTPSLQAQRSTPSHELSRRAQRGIMPAPALESRPSAPAPTSSSPISRLHVQVGGSGGGAAAAGRRAVLHEVLGSAAWTGAGTAPSSPLGATALSAGSNARGASSTDAARTDSGEAAAGGGGGGVTAAAASYGLGSASRAAGRAARLLESLQRLNVATPEVKPVQ